MKKLNFTMFALIIALLASCVIEKLEVYEMKCYNIEQREGFVIGYFMHEDENGQVHVITARQKLDVKPEFVKDAVYFVSILDSVKVFEKLPEYYDIIEF